MQNKKLKKIGSLFASFATATMFVIANTALAVRAEGNETSSAIADLPLIEINMKDANPRDTIKNLVIERSAQADPDLDFDNINMNESTAEFEGFDRNLSGIQTIIAKINLVYNSKHKKADNSPVGYSLVKKVAVKVEKNGAPILRLKNNTVTVNNGDKWNPGNYVSYINDESGILPVLKYSGNVDMNKDGKYSVTYTAIDVDGNTTSAHLNVIVQTPAEVIAEREKAAAEEAKKAAEEEKKRKEEELKAAAKQAETFTSSDGTPLRGNGNNPYSGGWGNCTWGAWQAVYSHTGVALPNWGNASSWVWNAQRSGYATGSTPVVGAVAVYSNHVAYVSEVVGDQVHIIEGNFNGHYNERWVSRYGTGTQSLTGFVYIK